MKRLLQSTLVLLAFSASIVLFQMSCKKAADAASPSTSTAATTTTATTQQNKLLVTKIVEATDGSGVEYFDLYTANYDGSGLQKVNITLSKGYYISSSDVKLSPDAKTIFFTAINTNQKPNTYPVYACNIDGTNPHVVFANTDGISTVAVAY